MFLQYELRIANGLKSQLLVSHRFLPFEAETSQKFRQLIDQVIFLIYSLNFCFKPLASPLMRGTRPARWRGRWYHIPGGCAALCRSCSTAAKGRLDSISKVRGLVPNPTEQAALTRGKAPQTEGKSLREIAAAWVDEFDLPRFDAKSVKRILARGA